MKLCSRLILILSLTIASNAYATITCNKPKLSRPTGNDTIYHFKAVVTCKLVGEKIDVATLTSAYRDEITNPKSQFKVHKQSDYDNKNGMTGYVIDATQSYTTENGPIVVRGNFTISSDKATNFDFVMRSTKIVGEGNNKYDKTIYNDTKLKVMPEYAELTVTKEVDIEEPWYAPHSTFVNTVEESLVKSIKKSAMDNAKKISGEKVDALRK